MEELKTNAQDLLDNIRKIADTYYKLAKLKTVEKTSSFLSTAITAIISIFLLLCFLFFIGVAASIWIGTLLQNAVAGNLIVAGFYLLLILFLIAIRKKVIFPFISKLIIRKVYD